MTKIIAFTGIKGSGKDTAAIFFNEIASETNIVNLIVQLAFADPLKLLINKTFDIDHNQADEIKRLNIKPFNGLTLREVYQLFGEAIKSQFGQDIWASLTISQIENFITEIQPDFILITDLRFTREEKFIKKYAKDKNIDLIIIKLENTNIENTDDHISETQIPEIKEDFLIKASTTDEIKIQMEEIYNAISK